MPQHRRKDKESDSSIDLAAQNQRLKQQQKKLNGRNNHIPMNINTEFKWTQLHHQIHTICKLD
jgi:hypothetical protein